MKISSKKIKKQKPIKTEPVIVDKPAEIEPVKEKIIDNSLSDALLKSVDLLISEIRESNLAKSVEKYSSENKRILEERFKGKSADENSLIAGKIDQMNANTVKLIEAINNRPKEFEFDIQRRNNVIEKIFVKPIL
jgi:hypothetical protein